MVKSLLSTSLLLLATTAFAQPGHIWQGSPVDSTLFSFEVTDSLNNTVTHDQIDTNSTSLWDIGTTSKAYFSMGTGNSIAIMTDTTDTYPTNANDWFTVRMERIHNKGAILTFRHKYQTTADHDGGIVEYSYDHGANWTNVLDSCNADADPGPAYQGIATENFYGATDTLLHGEWAFSGTSGWIQSTIQFGIGPIPLRTNIGFDCNPMDTVYVRFRFVSDDTLETLDGWMIDNIRVDHDNYWSEVKDVTKAGNLKVYPNPSFDGLISFPALKGEEHYTISISNITGSNVMTSPYKPTLDLSAQPKGMYFYKVTNGETTYTGRLVIE
jgi:hypothetical protein